jgi:hypothetical protein
MVRYGAENGSLAAPSITGAIVAPQSGFYAWEPSTWPQPPKKVDDGFIETLRTIFDDSMLGEIDNVIEDAQKSNGDLQHRGHVIAIALLCALDTVSFYGYGENGIPAFVQAHFPSEYHPHAERLLILYRHIMVHRWNLFRAALLPGNDPIAEQNGVLCFGLLHFRDALRGAVEGFLKLLRSDTALQSSTVRAYSRLRRSAIR